VKRRGDDGYNRVWKEAGKQGKYEHDHQHHLLTVIGWGRVMVDYRVWKEAGKKGVLLAERRRWLMFLTLVVSAAALMSLRSHQDTGEPVQRDERGSAGRGDAGWESGGGVGGG
jgi:hypothetical protein